MKKLLRSILAPAVFGLLVCQITGCKGTPSPPTQQDATAVWKHLMNDRPPITDELISLKKTNGQMSEVMGTKIYTLYFEDTQRSVVPLGSRPPGTITNHSGTYQFRLTDKGWLGPDNRVY
jgi:hypothetical protein